MTGCLYGIGVGPGDPELLTIKAVKRLRECEVIALPQESREECTAYRIAVQAVPEIEKKRYLCLPMPMTREKERLEKSHETAARMVAGCLERGEDVAFVTLGDVAVYSTFAYIQERVEGMGFETRMISGVPSFVAAAACLNKPLAKGAQQLHIIPASYPMGEALHLPGTKVLMKAGGSLPQIKAALIQAGLDGSMVENATMKNEQIYEDLAASPDRPGYYSLLIVGE